MPPEDRKYVHRSLTKAVEAALQDTPVICLLGPRQCGKSTLAEHLDPERLLISLDESRYLDIAKSDPDGFIASLPTHVSIDEIQRAPEILRAIKRSVDLDRRPGRFLLTGSANLLLLPNVDESLAGRMEIKRLQPLSESEKNKKPGKFLETLITNGFKPAIEDRQTQHHELVSRLLSGGYPEANNRTPVRARSWHREYIRSIVDRDVRDVARIKDADDVARLLKLLAIRTGELLNTSALANELKLSNITVEKYLTVLERLFLIRRLPSWQRNHANRLIKAPKIHLVDSGLSATLAGLDEDSWRDDRSRMGHLLESFVVQQIVSQVGWTNEDLQYQHYRDKDQLEVDLVITQGKKTWGIEVKASSSVSTRDTRGLKRLADICGEHFQGGVVLYNGEDTLPLSDSRLLAVPLSQLWNC